MLEEKNWASSYPRVAGGRAAFYSNNIYGLANKGTAIAFDKLESEISRPDAAVDAELAWNTGTP